MILDTMSATKRGFGTCALNRSLEASERSPFIIDTSKLKFVGSNPASRSIHTFKCRRSGSSVTVTHQFCHKTTNLVLDNRNVKNRNGNVLDMKNRRTVRITGKKLKPNIPS